jgi:hypothetical protein
MAIKDEAQKFAPKIWLIIGVIGGGIVLSSVLIWCQKEMRISQINVKKRTPITTKKASTPASKYPKESNIYAGGGTKYSSLGWPQLLGSDQTSILKHLKSLSKIGRYQGVIGAPITVLSNRITNIGFTIDKNSILPTLVGHQSTITLQVLDGYIRGAEIIFESGSSGPTWGMVAEALCSGVDYGPNQDPMLMMDQLRSEISSSSLPQQSERQGVWSLGPNLMIHYQLMITPKSTLSKGRVWISQQ